MEKTWLYNFRTREYGEVDVPITSWADYIPQDETAQQAYRLSVELGETPAAAAQMVLQGVLGRYQDTSNNNGK